MIDLFGPEPHFATPPTQLFVGTTNVRFKIGKTGIVGNGVSLAPFMTQFLKEREWVPRLSAYVTNCNYSIYDERSGYASIPRYLLDELVKFLEKRQVPYEIIPIQPVKPKPIKLKPKKGFSPRENQVAIIDFMTSAAAYKPISAQTGIGKQCTNSTPIKIPGGWTTHGTVRVGDIVTAWDGTPSRVDGVFPQGVQQIYRVNFGDGRYLDVGAEHLWTMVYPSDTGGSERSSILKKRVVNTLELLDRMQHPHTANRTYIPLCESELIDNVALPVHPYLLGVLLGDGSLNGDTVGLSTDSEIIDRIQGCLPENVMVGKETSPSRGTCHYVNITRIRGNKNPLVQVLQELGLWKKLSTNKFIPSAFLNASHDQRMALIRGLMDTDGTASKNGSIQYATSSERLAKDVQLLIRSVGGICSISSKLPMYKYRGEYRQGHRSYILNIRYRYPASLFSLERKKVLAPETNQYSENLKLRVTSVMPLPEKEECTCISIDHPDQLYVTKDFIVTHNTACAELAMCKLGVVTLIVLNSLIDQWYKSLRQHIAIASHEIYVVQGIEPLKKLWEAIKNGYRPKVLIFSTRTLVYYGVNPKGPYAELPSYAKLQEVLGIGFKIMDEVHLGFHANTRVDLVSNIAHNVYLSATYQRNHYQGCRIFNMVFPKELRFGEAFQKKFTTVHMLRYQLGIPPSDSQKMRSPKGYNHALYENYIRRNNRHFDFFMQSVVIPIIEMYFLNIRKPGQLMLILCQTRKFALRMELYLKKWFGNRGTVAVYFSGEKGKNGADRNLLADLIISTHKSCGTGRDIKNLKSCLNTVSFASSPLSSQVLGRLRELPGEDTVFIDIWNPEIGSHLNHCSNRLDVYKNKALHVFEGILQ